MQVRDKEVRSRSCMLVGYILRTSGDNNKKDIKEAVDKLISKLRDTSSEVRISAIKAIRHLQDDDSVIENIIQLSKDPVKDVS